MVRSLLTVVSGSLIYAYKVMFRHPRSGGSILLAPSITPVAFDQD